MIYEYDHTFVLETANTSYIFAVLPSGHLEHLYYGKRIHVDCREDVFSLMEKRKFSPGNTIVYDNQNPGFTLEDFRLEMSSEGKGDLREPLIEMTHQDGSRTCDFLYDYHEILDEKAVLNTLPSSYDESSRTKTLKVHLKDADYEQELILCYSVFEETDVIVKSTIVMNRSQEEVRLNRLLSNQIDFESNDYVFTTFHGAWAREMKKYRVRTDAGTISCSSYTGTSSNRANPFVMLSKENTDEDYGPCYGFNLIYSGNHYEVCDVNSFHKLRFLNGINPRGFGFVIKPGDSFESPEAVMTFSDSGFNGLSQNMHSFVRNHVVRGKWKNRIRPILLNSWEASYFKFNESKLMKLAKAGKDVGIELFVMDDGWFGNRDNDTCSLGDWEVNTKKLPNGVAGLAQKINDLGMDFGIWVEPEMVNVDSDLYRAHPDWTISIPGKPHSEGRTQRILDLCNPDVVEYIISAMEKVFSSANISYVKWDMNRIFSDYYSTYLDADRQTEVAHRYVMGLYRIMRTLTDKFPEILFEGCSAGGNRFDLGILSYFPQIWASDDTDAVYRVNGQTGYSYGYPMNTIGSHVSACPNHQTLRMTPLTTRFGVAAFGMLGYECNLCDASADDLKEIKEQIEIYKEWRDVLQLGKFYRGRSNQIHEWTCVSEDQSKAVGLLMKELIEPNMQFEQYAPKGLKPDVKYTFNNRPLRYNIKGFGDLINTAAPIHVKPDSLLHHVVAKFVTMPGETESYEAYGDTLMQGVKLHAAYAGTGYDEDTRYFSDFSSRIFFMKEKDIQ